MAYHPSQLSQEKKAELVDQMFDDLAAEYRATGHGPHAERVHKARMILPVGVCSRLFDLVKAV